MKLAYVDTSCLLAIAFEEPGSKALEDRLRRLDQLYASNLLEAEVRSALAREGVPATKEDLFRAITWVYPDRPLTQEFHAITIHGYLKGADLWHLACALFLAPHARELSFLTLDKRQRRLASALGFQA